MKFWDKLGRAQKRAAMVAGLIGSLAVIGAFTNKGVKKWNEYIAVPALADSLDKEVTLMWEAIQGVHDDQKLLERSNEMMWHLLMANTDKHGRKAYFITSMGDILMEGSKIDVFLRDDHVSPPEQWVFFKICDGRNCLHFLFSAKWSGVHEKFYFVDFQGEEHLIYEE